MLVGSKFIFKTPFSLKIKGANIEFQLVFTNFIKRMLEIG